MLIPNTEEDLRAVSNAIARAQRGERFAYPVSRRRLNAYGTISVLTPHMAVMWRALSHQRWLSLGDGWVEPPSVARENVSRLLHALWGLESAEAAVMLLDEKVVTPIFKDRKTKIDDLDVSASDCFLLLRHTIIPGTTPPVRAHWGSEIRRRLLDHWRLALRRDIQNQASSAISRFHTDMVGIDTTDGGNGFVLIEAHSDVAEEYAAQELARRITDAIPACDLRLLHSDTSPERTGLRPRTYYDRQARVAQRLSEIQPEWKRHIGTRRRRRDCKRENR